MPHLGCVKALAASPDGRLATGGTDNVVRLFDLKKRTEIGDLQEHADTVACLTFVGVRHLVTACDAGKICIWRTHDWEMLLKFQGHKAAITCVAGHPSERMLVSAARDKTLRLWDLTRGTALAQRILDHAVESLQWSPSGTHFAALAPQELVVIEASTGDVASFRGTSSGFMRINLTSVHFMTDGMLLLGDAKGEVRVLRLEKGTGEPSLVEVCSLQAEPKRGRVKVIKQCPAQRGVAGTSNFVTGDSTGTVEVWRFVSKGAVSSSSFVRERLVETRARLTDAALWGSQQAREYVVPSVASVAVKRKSEEGMVRSKKAKKTKGALKKSKKPTLAQKTKKRRGKA